MSARLDRTYRELIERVDAIPGVRSASMAQFTPTNPRGMTAPYVLSSGDEVRVFVPMVYPNYFATMGIPIVAGRDFDRLDTREESSPVAVVSESFAKLAFPRENAVGQRIRLGNETREVIGRNKLCYAECLRCLLILKHLLLLGFVE